MNDIKFKIRTIKGVWLEVVIPIQLVIPIIGLIAAKLFIN